MFFQIKSVMFKLSRRELHKGSNGEGGEREGKHIECLGGMRLHFSLTLFTRATPGTPASLY